MNHQTDTRTAAQRSAAGKATAATNRGKHAAAQERILHALQARIATEHPSGVIPPLAGGPFFRTLAGELGVAEYVLADLAKRLKAWPWGPEHVAKALFREKEEGQLK